MKLYVFAIGRLKERFLLEAEAEYHKRLRPMCALELRELRDEAALLQALPDRAHVYALDERGDMIDSDAFAHEILGSEQQHGGGAPVVFAIGGADGHGDAVRARARRSIAFGRMTIAHRLVRVLLAEQIYRGFTILRGTPYHRG
jgi:23S rRNA (pseudouridine1915-N3)-methyltransferase